MKQITTYKYCYGVSSRAIENKHVFMIDFDNVSFKTVTEYLIHVQNKMDFSDIYIIETKNGYNAICLDKIPFLYIPYLGNSVFSPADRSFLRFGFKRGYYVLRFGSDKKLVAVLKNKSTRYEKSLAHKKFLEWFFDISIECYPVDGNTMLDIVRYHSDKHGFHVVGVDK